MATNKKKVWFFKYETHQFGYVYLPALWYEFKRYYELNGKHADEWQWIEPIVDYEFWNVDTIVNEAISHNADVYMFSSYMWSWDMIKVIANAIREELPNAVIVLGGPHQHTTYTQPMFWFKDHPYFDATARPLDYGEYFVTDMLDAISEGNLDWSQVRGSYHRKGFGPEGNKREFKYPPDAIGHHIDHAMSVLEHTNDIGKRLGIMYETNRGCMYKCVYCEWGGGTNTKVVTKDMDIIYNDFEYFRQLEMAVIWITDANFGILKRDPEIAKLIASHKDYLKFVGITGLAKSKADKRKAVLEPLMEAKLSSVYQVSLQTIDESILKNIERTDVTPEENVELAQYLIKKYDIDVIVELILGLPGMTVETFYKEAAIEYTLLNSVKPFTHHVPLYLLPDAPVADPAYIEKFKIKVAPISLEERELVSTSDDTLRSVQLYKAKNYKKENTLHIPISTYSYTVEDWKEMFFMNDMNLVLMNMIMIAPFMDYLYHHKRVPLDIVFKKIFNVLSSVKEFYDPVYNDYLTPLAEGEYWDRSWRQFNVGPVEGTFTVHVSYAYLWTTNLDAIYHGLRTEFSEYLDPVIDDCLTYCKNSTFNSPSDVEWESKWRWDLWEESENRLEHPKEESVRLINRKQDIWWNAGIKTMYRNMHTVRASTNEPIKMKLFKMFREDE